MMVKLTGVVKHSDAHYSTEMYGSEYAENYDWQIGDVALWESNEGILKHAIRIDDEPGILWGHRDALDSLIEGLGIVKFSRRNCNFLGMHIKGMKINESSLDDLLPIAPLEAVLLPDDVNITNLGLF